MEYQDNLNDQYNDFNLKIAGFGPRWGAALVDANIFLLVGMFFFKSVFPLIRNYGKSEEVPTSLIIGAMFMYFIGLPLIGILYHALFECSKFQGSLGKIAVKIKVVNVHGGKVTFLQAVGRNAGKFISSAILYMGFFMAIWSDNKQTLHDMMAKTYVVLKY